MDFLLSEFWSPLFPFPPLSVSTIAQLLHERGLDGRKVGARGRMNGNLGGLDVSRCWTVEVVGEKRCGRTVGRSG